MTNCIGGNGEWSWLQRPYSRIEWEYKNDDGVWELKGKSVEVFKDGQLFILGKDITYDFIGRGKYHNYPGYMPD